MIQKHVEDAYQSLKLALANDPEPSPSATPWMDTARGELGVREIPGPKHDERVLEYLAVCHKDQGGNLGNWGAGRDETPWCSGFANWCLLRSGIEGTRHATARSWLKWGEECEIQAGAIAVLSRNGGGHVAFVDRWDARHVWLLGGNQGNRVCIKRYLRPTVLSYRWPTDA